MVLVRNSTVENVPRFVSAIEDFCPANPFIDEATDVAVEEAAKVVVGEISVLGDFLKDELANLFSAMEGIYDTSTKFVTETDDIKIDDWQSLIIIIPFTIVSCFLMLVAGLAWKGREIRQVLCLTRWFVLPLFIFMIVAAFAVSAGVAIAASSNADFCSGGEEQSPAGTITNIFKEEGYSDQDTVVKLAKLYMSVS